MSDTIDVVGNDPGVTAGDSDARSPDVRPPEQTSQPPSTAESDASSPEGSLDEYRLLTDPSGRRRHEGDEFFIVEGYVSLERAVASGHSIRSLLITEARQTRLADLIEQLAADGKPVHILSREELAHVTRFDAHRGVFASFTRRPRPDLHDLIASARRIIVLASLNDAENVGAIARASRALGADAIILDPRCTDEYSRRSVRVSMGEILFLPIIRDAAFPASLGALHDAGFETWALTPGAAAEDIWSCDVPDRLALILGAEGPGLEEATMQLATRRVRIPIHEDVDSVNVAQAAAIALTIVGRPSLPN